MAIRSKMVPLETARWQLGTVWFAGAGMIFLLLMIQSLTGVYEGIVQGVWGWALPNLAPMLSLMLGTFAGAAVAETTETDSMRVRRPFLRLSLGLSIFHLLAVGLTLCIRPFVPTLSGTDEDAMQLFVVSNLWLGPIQGLVAAALGALFFTRTAAEKPGSGDN